MAKINLRDYYPWYTGEEIVEVSDEVAEALKADKRYEDAYKHRVFRNKAHYSLDANDGIEEEAHEVFDSSDDPAVLLELKERHCALCRALNSLSDIQGRRMEAHFILGKSQAQIAEAEGISVVAVCQSIVRGLQAMKKYLENEQCPVNKCP